MSIRYFIVLPGRVSSVWSVVPKKIQFLLQVRYIDFVSWLKKVSDIPGPLI